MATAFVAMVCMVGNGMGYAHPTRDEPPCYRFEFPISLKGIGVFSKNCTFSKDDMLREGRQGYPMRIPAISGVGLHFFRDIFLYCKKMGNLAVFIYNGRNQAVAPVGQTVLLPVLKHPPPCLSRRNCPPQPGIFCVGGLAEGEDAWIETAERNTQGMVFREGSFFMFLSKVKPSTLGIKASIIIRSG